MTNVLDHAEARPVRSWGLVAILLCSAAWSSNALTVKETAGLLSPFGLGCARFALSGLLFLGWAALVRQRLHVDPHQRALVVLNGILMFAQVAAFNVGARATSTVHASLLISTFPLFSITIGLLMSGAERRVLSRTVLGGVASSSLGVSLLVLRRDDHGVATLWGDVLVLASAVIVGIKINFTKAMLQQLRPVQALFWDAAVAAPLFLAAWWHTDRLSVGAPTPRAVGALLTQGLLISGVCFGVWTVLLEKHSSTHLAALRLTTPLFAAVLGWTLLDEPVTARAVVGGALVVAGLSALVTGQDQGRPPRTPRRER